MTNREFVGLLREGLSQHRSGDLERAGRLYCEILSDQPYQPGVLHLFGVVLHQMGDHEAASQAIGRAISLRPNEAHFHSNLAVVYRSTGRDRLAIGSRTLAMRLRPDLFEAPEEFDLLLQPGGWPVVEGWSVQDPSPILSDDVIELDRIAFDLRNRGDRAGAIEHASRAVQLAPRVGALHCKLGQYLLEGGRADEALHHCTEASRLAPSLPEAHNNLGNVLRAFGRTMEAKGRYLDALRLNPDLAYVYTNLSWILNDEGWESEAITWSRIGLELDPGSLLDRWSLATSLKELGYLEEARRHCREGLRLDPNSRVMRVTLGSICHLQRRNEEAARHFQDEICSNLEDVDALGSLGLVRLESGEFEEAERCFRRILEVDGGHARAFFELASMLGGKLPEDDLARIDRLLSGDNLEPSARADLHFGAAQVHDARRDYARAGEHLRRANGIKRALADRTGREYRVLEHDELVNEIMAAFSADFFRQVEGSGSTSERPVFVFGLPRSGTTLTEQILASHSKVYGAGETILGRRNFEKLVAAIGRAKCPSDCLDFVDRGLIDRFAREHLEGLDEFDRDAPIVIDKLPENYLYIGLLAALFPRARFIHCRRDLRDTAVSCWATNFRKIPWANDFDHIASRFSAYRRILEHWAKVLPVPILEVDYEETVDDLEGVARRLVDWCGLDWEPACLAFHQSGNPVQTASMNQVRQPIYRRSVERWRNYEADLGPLFARLEEIGSRADPRPSCQGRERPVLAE